MNDEVKIPDPVEALIGALTARLIPAIKAQLMPEIEIMLAKVPVKIEADDIEGLEGWIQNALDEHDRHLKINADDIEDLDKAIEEHLKNGTFSIEFSC